MTPDDQGMTLSGGEVPETQERIIAGLKESYPQTSKSYVVCTDTFGSIATALPRGKHCLRKRCMIFLQPSSVEDLLSTHDIDQTINLKLCQSPTLVTVMVTTKFYDREQF